MTTIENEKSPHRAEQTGGRRRAKSGDGELSNRDPKEEFSRAISTLGANKRKTTRLVSRNSTNKYSSQINMNIVSTHRPPLPKPICAASLANHIIPVCSPKLHADCRTGYLKFFYANGATYAII